MAEKKSFRLEAAPLERSLLYVEPGPTVLVTTFDGRRANVMTITWTMAMDFAQHVALCTGPWNHSFKALEETRECVVAVPPASLAETVVKVGDVSGAKVDKFARFGLTALPAETVKAPLVGECLASMECTVEDIVQPYGIVVLQVRKLWENRSIRCRRLLHAFGDGTFAADGRKLNLRHLMADKMPPGL